ncbi:unnamed protein product [Cylicocyclus nassatus]|uniref:C2H2-type domain-containing protein n=1 Tax=Cylicocyclus nassatus TaxID=53992 RepID=A0AA36DTK9_CYLNA|nr:unnamed protein product [Cylicocyclus nassatus]
MQAVIRTTSISEELPRTSKPEPAQAPHDLRNNNLEVRTFSRQETGTNEFRAITAIDRCAQTPAAVKTFCEKNPPLLAAPNLASEKFQSSIQQESVSAAPPTFQQPATSAAVPPAIQILPTSNARVQDEVVEESDDDNVFQVEPDDDCILLDDEPAGHDSFDEIEYTDTQPATGNAYHLDSDYSFNDEAYETVNKNYAYCDICNRGPFLVANLYKHLRNVHKCSQERINRVRNDLKKAMFGNEFTCECGAIYHSKDGLRKHKSAAHPTESTHASHGVTCPICDRRSASHLDLIEHCRHSHPSADLTVQRKTFASWSSFEVWKEEEERRTCSKLVKRGFTKTSKGIVHMYGCHNANGAGGRIDATERKQRYRKTRRVHKNCTCYAKVTQQEGGMVNVIACFGHVGHELNSATIPLSGSDVAVVRSMIEAGIPTNIIVSKLRTTRWLSNVTPQRQARLCFITARDVANIAARYGLVEGMNSKDDRQSLRTLVEDQEQVAAVELCETSNPSGDGFVLAFVTVNGKKYLDRYGYRGLVFDDTFNVTRYCFRLATLLVADDGGNGFPCAHLLSYRMTSKEVEILFELVKECVPHFEPQFVVTDDTYVFFNAFKKVFPSSRANKLLCSFHISQSFERKHKELLGVTNASAAQSRIKRILIETDPLKFENAYADYLSWLTMIGATQMKTYVEKTYTLRKTEWARCYRNGAPFHTSNHAEAWHRKLKHTILQNKQNSRLDCIVWKLLQHSHNLDLQLTSSLVRNGCDLSNRRKINVQMHKQAIQLYRCANAIIWDAESSWKVLSSTRGVEYRVVFKQGCDCNEQINSHCERCNVCAYQVSCSCLDDHRAGISCIHAHAVATYVPEAKRLLRPLIHRLDSRDAVTLPENANAFEGEGWHVGNVVGTEEEYIGGSVVAEEVIAEDHLKEIYHDCEGAQAHLAEVTRTLFKNKNYDLLDQVSRGVRKVLGELPVQNVQFARRKVLQTTGTGPKPQPIEVPYKKRSTVKAEKKQKRK